MFIVVLLVWRAVRVQLSVLLKQISNLDGIVIEFEMENIIMF